MTEINNDHHLVQLLQKGNFAAFDSLFEIYSQKLYCLALKYFKNETDAEELVQEVFVKVWENRRTLKSGLSFKSYLFTIAMNQIRKHFNKKAVSLRYIESLQNEPELEQSPALQEDDYESALQQITLIIGQMPPRRREIFTRSKLEGKSSKVIAQEMNISAGTVDNQVSEALGFIRSRLNTLNSGVMLIPFMLIF